ncbi:MAG: phage tail protein [Vicinamibacterales bacterium]
MTPADPRARPVTGANFLVSIGEADPAGPDAGFCDVVFPVFAAVDPARPDTGAGLPPSRLTLRRAATGRLDLYEWWSHTRGTKGERRTVTVQLLDEDHRGVVMAWRFHGAYPVTLAYSPLHAMAPGLVTETVELAFDRVEVLSPA